MVFAFTRVIIFYSKEITDGPKKVLFSLIIFSFKESRKPFTATDGDPSSFDTDRRRAMHAGC